MAVTARLGAFTAILLLFIQTLIASASTDASTHYISTYESSIHDVHTKASYTPNPYTITPTMTLQVNGESHNCALSTAAELHCNAPSIPNPLTTTMMAMMTLIASSSQSLSIPMLLLAVTSLIPTSNAQYLINGNTHQTCSVHSGGVKCWGYRKSCDPSYNGTDGYIELPPIDDFDLGDADGTFTASSVHCGPNHCCAVSTSGTARCWGDNSNGQLGYSNTDYFSDSTNFGHDVDLGTFTIDQLATGNDFTCALSTANQVKCFGLNDYGQLGLGDTTNRGDTFGQMGNDLPAIDFGTFLPVEITVGG
jgi:hypothetical protein